MRALIASALAASSLWLAVPAHATWLDDSVALDAVYIPALSHSSAAQNDADAAPRAVQATQRLTQQWPGLRERLRTSLGGPGVASALADIDRRITQASTHVAQARFGPAHEALEGVRERLGHLRSERGYDYFVDRLTAFNEPMETLALAGRDWKPAELTPERRATLEQAFAHARALWHGVESQTPQAAAYALDDRRLAQLRQGMEGESAALSRLSQAFRGSDAQALLKAAAAIKPPFARTFTAFGHNGP